MHCMTDLELRDALIRGDEEVTREFFYSTCRPLLISVIRRVFDYEVDYDECINELYIHLMEDEARRIKQFAGRSSIYQWVKIVATRFYRSIRRRVIENSSTTPLFDKTLLYSGVSNESRNDARMDIESLLDSMPNSRYAMVLRRLIVEDADPQDVAKEMNIRIENLYNIKKRAMAALTQMVLFETGKYEKEICK